MINFNKIMSPHPPKKKRILSRALWKQTLYLESAFMCTPRLSDASGEGGRNKKNAAAKLLTKTRKTGSQFITLAPSTF